MPPGCLHTQVRLESSGCLKRLFWSLLRLTTCSKVAGEASASVTVVGGLFSSDPASTWRSSLGHPDCCEKPWPFRIRHQRDGAACCIETRQPGAMASTTCLTALRLAWPLPPPLAWTLLLLSHTLTVPWPVLSHTSLIARSRRCAPCKGVYSHTPEGSPACQY